MRLAVSRLVVKRSHQGLFLGPHPHMKNAFLMVGPQCIYIYISRDIVIGKISCGSVEDTPKGPKGCSCRISGDWWPMIFYILLYIWGFPKIGAPLVIVWDFPWNETSSELGVPLIFGNLHMVSCIDSWCFIYDLVPPPDVESHLKDADMISHRGTHSACSWLESCFTTTL